MTQDLAVGDRIEQRHGPFESTWEVIQIIEPGARLAYVEGSVRFVGWPINDVAPNGRNLTTDTNHGFLGRAHWAAARRADGSSVGSNVR